MRNIEASRSRTLVLENKSLLHTKNWIVDGASYSTWPRTSVVLYAEKTTDDTSTPNYKRLVAEGAVLCKDYRNTRSSLTMPLGTYTQQAYIYGAWRDTWHYRCNVYQLGLGKGNVRWPEWPSHDIDSIVGACMQRAYSKIDAAEIANLVMLAELDKTVDMFRDLAAGVMKHARGTLRKKLSIEMRFRLLIKKAKRDPKAVRKLLVQQAAELSQLWLGARFGLRPFYYDMMSVVETLTRMGKRRIRIKYGAAQLPELGVSTQPRHTIVTPAEGYFQVESQRILLTEVHGGVYVEPQYDPETIARLQGITNIPEVLWELVPYSFFIDWFINVGEVIASLTPELDIILLSSYATVTQTKTEAFQVVGCSMNNNGFAARGTMQGFSYSDSSTVRTRYAYPDVPVMPHFKLRFNALKAVDTVGLLKNVVAQVRRALEKRARI